MTRARSSAYWAGNRYIDEGVEPSPLAPLEDLPPAPAARFKAVRYMGATWRWAWEYGVGNRKLCWIHVVGNELSATFTMSDGEEDRLTRGGRVPGDIKRAIEVGQRTGPLKWCWVPLDDRRSVDTFLRLAGRKAEWLAERPTVQRAPKLRARRQAESSGDEPE
jgi:hypothetical protein